MKASHPVGRNETCPCGSGRKFKVCCLGKSPTQEAKRSPVRYVAFGVVGVALAIVIAKTAFGPAPAGQTEVPLRSLPSPWPAASTATPEARPNGQTPQPPGPVPEGKIWSPEHGHWHDITTGNGQAVATSGNTAATGVAPALIPQPPGPVPQGKVWSPEHGHWHDIPSPSASSSSSPPPP